MQTIAFYYGLGSRYSYLAFTQIERIESEYGCRFDLHPISSIDLMQLCGPSPFEGRPVSGQYDWGYRESLMKSQQKFQQTVKLCQSSNVKMFGLETEISELVGN